MTPKYCKMVQKFVQIAAAKGSTNMILEQSWYHKDAKWTKAGSQSIPKTTRSQEANESRRPHSPTVTS
jgi:hypothetical protein